MGKIEVEVPARDNKPKRIACLEIRFGKFMMNPSQRNIRYRTEELSNLPLYAVYVVEKDSSSEISPLEWMLLFRSILLMKLLKRLVGIVLDGK